MEVVEVVSVEVPVVDPSVGLVVVVPVPPVVDDSSDPDEVPVPEEPLALVPSLSAATKVVQAEAAETATHRAARRPQSSKAILRE